MFLFEKSVKMRVMRSFLGKDQTGVLTVWDMHLLSIRLDSRDVHSSTLFERGRRVSQSNAIHKPKQELCNYACLIN